MTLAASGQITTAQIMAELQRSGQQFVSNDSGVCALAGKAANAQVLIPNDFWGKSYLTITGITTAGSGTSRTLTVQVSGGNGTNAYSWSVTGDLEISGSSSSASVTIVSAGGASVGTNSNGTAYVTVTSGGATANSSKAVVVTSQCVAASSYLYDGVVARDLLVGHPLLVLSEDYSGTAFAPATAMRLAWQPGVRLRSTSGIELDCSESTPVVGPAGAQVWAANSLGHPVAVEDERGFRWEHIAAVEDLGLIEVARISVSDKVYAAGRREGAMMFTHNIKN